MTATRSAAIFHALADAASSDQMITWQQMQEAVTRAGVTVRNWLAVRAVLQDMVSRGMYTRTDDLFTETYIRN